MSPTVDILVPFYGDAALLREAVTSVLAQGDPNWRLTVVDDDNPAGGPESIEDWFATIGDPRVRYLRNPRNLGLTANFNRCLDLVEHDLAVLLGCDDRLLPNYVGTVRAVHDRHPDAGIIQPGVRVIGRDGRPVRTLVDEVKRRVYAPRTAGRAMAGEELAISLLRGDWLYFPSLAWRADVLTSVRFRADLRVIQDLALLMELVCRGVVLVADDTVCFEYRRHDASESSATAFDGSRFTEAGAFFADTAARLAEHGWPAAARVARRHLSSRIFALTMLPRALHERAGVGALARHVVGESNSKHSGKSSDDDGVVSF